ncbi:MAG TPA: hypothetical protein VK553_01135 [Candidatus Nitrosopolaris rasttigaisensis]|jgi:hypothetical protein|nr:hypothetical protein [Candidatus Nitrosopolaris rasttigaisensis]
MIIAITYDEISQDIEEQIVKLGIWILSKEKTDSLYVVKLAKERVTIVI